MEKVAAFPVVDCYLNSDGENDDNACYPSFTGCDITHPWLRLETFENKQQRSLTL